jgi:hypothetical protein
VKYTKVVLVFTEASQTLWLDGVKFDNVLLLVTDAAPNTKEAAEELSVSRPKLIHVSMCSACFALSL